MTDMTLLGIATRTARALSWSMRNNLVHHVAHWPSGDPYLHASGIHMVTLKALADRGLIQATSGGSGLHAARILLSPMGRTVWEIVLQEEIVKWREMEAEADQAWRDEKLRRQDAESTVRAFTDSIPKS